MIIILVCVCITLSHFKFQQKMLKRQNQFTLYYAMELYTQLINSKNLRRNQRERETVLNAYGTAAAAVEVRTHRDHTKTSKWLMMCDQFSTAPETLDNNLPNLPIKLINILEIYVNNQCIMKSVIVIYVSARVGAGLFFFEIQRARKEGKNDYGCDWRSIHWLHIDRGWQQPHQFNTKTINYAMKTSSLSSMICCSCCILYIL